MGSGRGKRPKVLLIQSKTEFQSELTHRPFLPLGLLSIATPLKDDCSVAILDQRASKRFTAELDAMLEAGPLCVGITCLTGKQIRYALAISRYIRRKTSAPVLWGGCHPTALPEQTLQDPAIDMVMQGEADTSFRDLIRVLSDGGNLRAVPGLWFKQDGGTCRGPASRPPDLAALPIPDYSLVNMKDYAMYRRFGPTLPVEASRGCPAGCRFCHCSSMPGWRPFPIDRVVENVAFLVRNYHVTSILFVDDNFFVDRRRARSLFERLLSEGLRPSYELQGVRIDSLEEMDDEYLRFLERAGVRKLDIGVESGSTRILEFIQKGITPERVKDVNRRLRDYSFLPQYNFMGGFPTETREDLKKTLALMFDLMRDNPKAIVSWMHVYSSCPNTSLHKWEVRQGILREPTRLEQWADVDRQIARSRPIEPRERALLENLYFASHFLDKKATYYFDSRLLQILFFLYRPVARFRVRRFFFGFMVEKALFDAISGWVHRSRAL